MLIIFLAIPWVFKYSKMQKYSQDESVPWKRERKKENIVVCAHLPIWLFCHSSAHISIYLATLSSFLPSHVHLFPTSFFYSLRCQYGNRPLSFPIGKAIRSSSPFWGGRRRRRGTRQTQQKERKKKDCLSSSPSAASSASASVRP